MARPPAPITLISEVRADEEGAPRGNFAPVREEQTVRGPFPVDGAIPPSLSGMLVRNGPNPAVIEGVRRRWSDGDGMLHALTLHDGRATSYRNRWVRTRRLSDDLGVPVPPGPAQPVQGPANTNVLWHAGRLLALCGTGLPERLDPSLTSLGPGDFDGMLTSPMAAHPKVDPLTGGLTFVGHDPFGPPYLRYHEADRGGSLVHSTDVAIPRPTLVRDIGVTATRIVFLDLPVVLSGPAPAAGLGPDYRWTPDAGARLGVLPRGADGVNTVWAGTDPCHVAHVVNAYDERRAVVLDVLRADQLGAPGAPPSPSAPHLERWRIHPPSGRVHVTVVDDQAVEMPRIDPLRAGRPYRFVYCVETGRGRGAGGCGSLVQYDLARDEARAHRLPDGVSPGEPLFVGATGGGDDEGWVLSLAHDAARDATDLVILDASSFAGPPVAVVHLPVRVPFGLHGAWVPASQLP